MTVQAHPHEPTTLLRWPRRTACHSDGDHDDSMQGARHARCDSHQSTNYGPLWGLNLQTLVVTWRMVKVMLSNFMSRFTRSFLPKFRVEFAFLLLIFI